MDEEYDVLIVGAGPAGSVAGRFLAAAGLDVLMIDKKRFPRRKACGDGISPRATRNLIELGMGAFLRENAFRADHYCFRLGSGKPIRVSLELSDLYPPFGYVMMRSELDMELLRSAVENGARLLEGVRFTGIERETDGRWTITFVDREKKLSSIRASFLIGADGAPSAVARLLGKVNRHGTRGIAISCHMKGVNGLERQMEFIYDREILPGAGWIFPLGRDLANVGIGIVHYSGTNKKANLRSLWKTMLETSPGFTPRLRDAEAIDEPRAGILPFHMFDVNPVGDGLVLIGDAAGMINPFCGEGLTFALESGWLAARAILQAWPRKDSHLLQHYGDEMRALYALPFRVGGTVIPLLHNPFVSRALSIIFGGKARLNDRLFPLVYRNGANNWKRLFPGDDGIFTVPSLSDG